MTSTLARGPSQPLIVSLTKTLVVPSELVTGVYEFPRKLPEVKSSYHRGFEIPEVSSGNAASFKHKLTTEFATVGANGNGFTITVI